ncbi:ABC transporter substrate-binding protein [Desertimonas flava]|uniref:ABC transporter substrate-binding protein n=1 Tax=Desertimonas flava TaxID=2064846 RepID=UPI000E34E55F|nr:ABC transporter substrate-binding protein [Desertimonas flava]
MNRTPRRHLLAVPLTLALVAFAAPGSAPAATSPPDVASADRACSTVGEGGDITVGAYSFTQSLDPTIAGSNGLLGASELAAIYDTLIRFDPETGAFEPRVAESLEPNEDFTVWTLVLRNGVTFGNGDQLTAQDVKASIERHLAEDSTSTFKSLVTIISEMTVVDDLTVEFTLSETWPKFPYALTLGPGMITNPRVVQEHGENFVSNPVGAGVGPFDLERFAPNEEVVLTPRDDYWGGVVCPSSLRFIAVSGGQATYDAMVNGELDVMINRDSRVIAQAKSDGLEGFDYIVSSGWLFALNSGAQGSTPPTADVRIRRAIAAAIDVNIVNERAEDGDGIPTSLAIAPGSLLYQDLPGPAYDPELAASLVEEVKAEGEWDGSVRFQCSPDPLQSEQALAASAMLEAVGFTVEMTTTATIGDMVTKVVGEGDFDISCWGFNVFDSNVWGGLKGLGSVEASNYYGYNDPNMDAALAALRIAATLDEEKAALADLQAAWTDTVPHIVLGAATNFVGYAQGVSGLVPTADTIILYDQATSS